MNNYKGYTKGQLVSLINWYEKKLNISISDWKIVKKNKVTLVKMIKNLNEELKKTGYWSN